MSIRGVCWSKIYVKKKKNIHEQNQKRIEIQRFFLIVWNEWFDLKISKFDKKKEKIIIIIVITLLISLEWYSNFEGRFLAATFEAASRQSGHHVIRGKPFQLQFGGSFVAQRKFGNVKQCSHYTQPYSMTFALN